MIAAANPSQNEMLSNILCIVNSKQKFKSALKLFPHFTQRRAKSLQGLTVESVRQFFHKDSPVQSLQPQVSYGSGQQESSMWIRNQRSVFEWLAVAYISVHSPSLPNEIDTVLSFMKQIFPAKCPYLLLHGLRSLLKESSRSKLPWKPQAVALFQKIVTREDNPIDWGKVSMKLLKESEGQFFESTVACREKWNNHLNPRLNKEAWKIDEEYRLLQEVTQNGCRWSVVASKLGEGRNDHMVKNHYKKLMRQEIPEHLKNDQEAALEFLLRKKETCYKKYMKSQARMMAMEAKQAEETATVEHKQVVCEKQVESEELAEVREEDIDQQEMSEHYLNIDDIFECLEQAKSSLETIRMSERRTRQPAQTTVLTKPYSI